MKRIVMIGALLALGACATKPQPIVRDNEVSHMSREEVIAAVQECHDSGNNAMIQYAKADWRGKLIPVPVDVQCMPINARRVRAPTTGSTANPF